MKKGIFWIGIVVFIIAVVCFFLSGSTSGPSPAEAKPTVPLLYGTNQLYWILLSVIGVIIIVVGALIKKK